MRDEGWGELECRCPADGWGERGGRSRSTRGIPYSTLPTTSSHHSLPCPSIPFNPIRSQQWPCRLVAKRMNACLLVCAMFCYSSARTRAAKSEGTMKVHVHSPTPTNSKFMVSDLYVFAVVKTNLNSFIHSLVRSFIHNSTLNVLG